MITRFDFVLLLCIHRCIPSNCNAMNSDKCTPCSLEQCTLCNMSKPLTTQCPDTTCPTSNPSTSVCSCPATEAVDCSQCLATTTTKTTTTSKPTTMAAATITTTPQTTITTTPQITETTTATTTPTTGSAYPDPADQKSASFLGAVIGAAIGGAIFGSFLTAIIFVYIRRRSKNPYNSKNDQTTKTVRNAAYGYSNDTDQVNSVTVPVNSAYSEINDGMRKSAVISPIMRQADSLKIDGVYNHLGESDKEDRGDYYDHAGPAPSLSVMEDGYGVLSMEREGNDNYNTVDANYSTDYGKSMTDENKQSNDYFILETQND